jgi:hypothetical protein
MSQQTIDLREFLTFLSPAGQQQIVEFIHRAQAERGANWLPEIQAEFPMFSWIVELVCNRTADEAFAELQSQFPNYPLQLAKGAIKSLHGRLKSEIEVKRG